VADTASPSIVGIENSVDRPGTSPKAEPLSCWNRRCGRRSGQLLQAAGAISPRSTSSNLPDWLLAIPEIALSERLGIKPAHAYTPVGWAKPIALILHESPQRIARGNAVVAAVSRGGHRPQPSPNGAVIERRGRRSRTTFRIRSAARRSRNRRGQAFGVVQAVSGPIRFNEAPAARNWGQTPRGDDGIRQIMVAIFGSRRQNPNPG